MDEVRLLENDAEIAPAKLIQLALIQVLQNLPVDFDFSGCGLEHAAQQVKQRCFSRSGLTEQQQLISRSATHVGKRHAGRSAVVLKFDASAMDHGMSNLRREQGPEFIGLLLNREFSSTVFALRHRGVHRCHLERPVFQWSKLQRLVAR